MKNQYRSFLLELTGLTVRGRDRLILRGVNLTVNSGEKILLLGPNGAGKSTLAHTLAGQPPFPIERGQLWWQGQEATTWSPERRARSGWLVTWQTPVAMAGVSVATFLRQVVESQTGQPVKAWDFRSRLLDGLARLRLPATTADRDWNVGFSGGESKKLEMLTLMLLRPQLVVLDELDSGLDSEAASVMAENLQAYLQTNQPAVVMISHTLQLVEAVPPDRVLVMIDGQIVAEGDEQLVAEVRTQGYRRWRGVIDDSRT